MRYRWHALILLVALLNTSAAARAEHLVSSADLHQTLVEQFRQREANLAQLRDFLNLPPVTEALQKTGVETERLNQAVATLSDPELLRLAAQAEKIRSDFAAGQLTNQQLTYIVIALAAAVIVLIAVA